MKQSTRQHVHNTLKIGLVCDDSLDRPDGVQQFVVTLGEWLRSRGHDVHYLTSTTHRTDLQNLHVLAKNVEVKFNGNRLRPPLPASPRKIRELLRRESFDVLHIQMPYSPMLAGQIIQFAPLTTAIVGTFHILPESQLVAKSSRALGLVIRPQLRKFSNFSSTSIPTRLFMKEVYRVDSTVIPNMTDVSKFSIHPPKRNNYVKVVFLGRLVERKGAGYLLQTISHLESVGLPQTKYHVHIGGKGVLKNKLEKYVLEHNLQNLVSFDGFITEDDKASYLASGDVAVFPSTGGESFGISLIEAMAATPGAVLAGDNPGYASVMGEHTKQLINPKDTETFAHILARYIDNSTDRAVARSWQKQAVLHYDVRTVGLQFEEFYNHALRNEES